VHVIGKWIAELPCGTKPFQHISAQRARDALKRYLLDMGVAGASEHWLHDLRRGHAQDLLDSGARLNEILAAGEWASPRFTAYLDMEGLENAAVVEAHMMESDDEE